MIKLFIGLLAIGSFSLRADTSDLCQHAMEGHLQRLDIIHELSRTGELPIEEVDSRIKDSEAIFKITKSIMCKGISKKEKRRRS